jgi:nitroreductase
MKDMSFPVLARNRRSCRKFSGEHIPDEILEKIIADAAYAPSSWGGHPMEYIIIRDRNTLKKLASCKQMGAGPLAYGDAAIETAVCLA